eukprot:1066694-Rhodomonas_salina.3
MPIFLCARYAISGTGSVLSCYVYPPVHYQWNAPACQTYYECDHEDAGRGHAVTGQGHEGPGARSRGSAGGTLAGHEELDPVHTGGQWGPRQRDTVCTREDAHSEGRSRPLPPYACATRCPATAGTELACDDATHCPVLAGRVWCYAMCGTDVARAFVPEKSRRRTLDTASTSATRYWPIISP